MRPGKDGVSLIASLRQAARTLKKDEAEFIASRYRTAPPWDLAWLWEVFVQLSSTRRSGHSGPESISFVEIDAWSRLYDFKLTPMYVDALRAMDSVWLRELADGNDG